MDDLISRQAATTVPVLPKEHRHYQTSNLDDAYEQGWNDLRECIENLPSAQPEQRWIPVTERLPEPRIDVWCYSDLGQMVGYYDETVEAWYGRDYLELMVTAWMPLPEPYREEGTMYKLLTPDFREKINRGIDQNIEELLRCDRNSLVIAEINAYQMLRNMINSLPDGCPIPVEKRGQREGEHE